MGKKFREWNVEQRWLLPASILDFVAEGHLAHFVRDTVRGSLDLSEILGEYEEERGYPPYHPVMMTALLLYGYLPGSVFVAQAGERLRRASGLHGSNGDAEAGLSNHK